MAAVAAAPPTAAAVVASVPAPAVSPQASRIRQRKYKQRLSQPLNPSPFRTTWYTTVRSILYATGGIRTTTITRFNICFSLNVNVNVNISISINANVNYSRSIDNVLSNIIDDFWSRNSNTFTFYIVF